jgi:hypothetical protein
MNKIISATCIFLLCAALAVLLCPGRARAAEQRTVTSVPEVVLTLDGDWQVQGQPAAIKSYPNFKDIEDSINLVALRGGQVLFVMAQPSLGRSLMQVAQAYEQLMSDKTAAAQDLTVYRQNFVLLPCGKCRHKNRLAHLMAATGRGRDLGATAHYLDRRINHVSVTFISGAWLVTIVYFASDASPELPAAVKPLIDSLMLKGYEDPREVVFKEVIKYVPAGTAPACAARMSELAAVTAAEYKSVDIPAIYKGKKMPDWMKDSYAAPVCECYKVKDACERSKK